MNSQIALSPDGIDVQASRPATRVSLSRVGVTGVEKVLSIGTDGHYHAELECFVDLGPDQAGVHMSRFEENVAEAIEEVVASKADAGRGAGRPGRGPGPREAERRSGRGLGHRPLPGDDAGS